MTTRFLICNPVGTRRTQVEAQSSGNLLLYYKPIPHISTTRVFLEVILLKFSISFISMFLGKKLQVT